MSDHSSSVFNNSCLKLPRNAKNAHPLSIHEQKFLNHLRNEATKAGEIIPQKDSLIAFVDSIPEYDDIHHLSNREFYEKIQRLKDQQKTYYNFVQSENAASSKWPMDEYLDIAPAKDKRKKTAPILSKSPKTESESDRTCPKPSSRRSVRIETPSEAGTTPSDLFRPPDDVSTIEEYDQARPKSAPASPSRPSRPNVAWKDTITIPRPFQMTVRDEENQIVDELLIKPPEPKPEMFKAHSIPIESQIPLFDKIMADQERKNYIVRERSKASLQSQMRPFSFTRRDEEIQSLTRALSKSSPSLFLDDPPIQVKKFRAKPVPRNLFSNYIYQKMHEDEFYRALQKKIRAEEMLRSASLPPSMAKREKSTLKYDVCPRSYRDVLHSYGLDDTRKKAKNNYNFDKELEELRKDFIGASLKNSSKSTKSKRRRKQKSASSSNATSRTISSLDLRSINRSNLAAVLRIQSAQKRLEQDMGMKLEQSKIKEEARWREKIMRKKPIWESLAYSHEEDLAMRLQLRRDEERLRSEEHKLRMHLMLGRVNQQPTLFERQSHLQYPKTKQELLDKLYEEYEAKKAHLRCRKDAAIQALLEEEESVSSKEILQEEKEKCDSTSSEEP